MVGWSVAFGSGGEVEPLDQVVGLVGVVVAEQGDHLGVVELRQLGVAESAVGERAVDLLLAAELIAFHIP